MEGPVSEVAGDHHSQGARGDLAVKPQRPVVPQRGKGTTILGP